MPRPSAEPVAAAPAVRSEADLARSLERAGVLLEHRRAALAQFPDDVRAEVKAWQAARPRRWTVTGLEVREGDLIDPDTAMPHGLAIKGPVGTGKTHLAAAIARSMLTPARFSLEFLHARKLFRRLWECFGDDAKRPEQEAIDELTKCLVLVIDDLGHEGRVSEAVVGALHEILTIRNGEYRTTIVTTNLTLDEIAKAYDPSIASRIGGWAQIVLVGDDRRQPR